jgi:hypothetical protein
MSSDEGKSWRTITAPSQLAYAIYRRVIDPQGCFYAQGTPSGSIEEIWRYDPATDAWSKVTQAAHPGDDEAPLEGDVLAGTSTGANGTTVLWFMSTTGQPVLYRYVI